MLLNWNKAFWLIFIVLGLLVIAGSMVHIVYIDIIFGLLVIGVGSAKLAEEITHRRLQMRHRAMNESIGYLTKQVEGTSSTAEHLRDLSDSRFFKVDRRLTDMDEKMETKYDDSVKKVISLENRLNEHSRHMLEIAKRQQKITERQAEISERLRHLPRSKPVTISTPRSQVYVPATIPEKKIIRFELPKIAPRSKAKPKEKKAKTRNVKVPRKGRTIVSGGRTIINIQAPKPQIIRKVVRVKAKTKPKAPTFTKMAKALKRTPAKKVKTKPKGKLKKVELLLREN